jgi:putative cardiolipin synthase
MPSDAITPATEARAGPALFLPTRRLGNPALALALMLALLLAQGCASLPAPEARPPSLALPASLDNELGRIAAQSLPTQGGSGFRPLPLSSFSMDARLALARHAKQSLDLQYYLLADDVTGHKLLRALRDAAQRGVRVRVLVDDLYTASSNRLLLQLAAHPGVEVRLFNPFASGRGFGFTRWVFSAFDFPRLNHRMHNKMFIADGAFAVAGGRNIADEYFFNSKDANFVDFDLLVAGDAVPRMAAVFDSYWNSRRVYPLQSLEHSRQAPETQRAEFEQATADAETAYPTPAPDRPDLLGYRPLSAELERPPLKLLDGSIEVVADDPEKVSGRAERGNDATTVTAHLLKAMAQAKTELMIGSPYFIPGPVGMRAMQGSRDEGVRIDVLTNALASNDEPFASAAYARYRVPMLKMGVSIDECESSLLKKDALIGPELGDSVGRSHAKLVVIDRHLSFVGSANLDFRSSRENTELGLLVESPALAEQVLSLARRVRAVGSYHLRLRQPGNEVEWISDVEGTETVYDSDPEVDLVTRLEVLLLSPFVAESLL